eukprot:gene10302-13071_t
MTTKKIGRRTSILMTGAALATPLAPSVRAQQTGLPDKPLKILVGFPAGGGTDVIARIVQERFQALLGQPVVIDNRGGAAGSIGTELVA